MRIVIYKEWIRGVETEEYKALKETGRYTFSGVKWIEGTNCYIEKEGLFHGFYADSDEGSNFTSAIIELSDGSVVTAGVTGVRFIDTPAYDQFYDIAKAALACVPARFKGSNGEWNKREVPRIAEEVLQIAEAIILGIESQKQ